MNEVTFGFVKPDAYSHRDEILREFILPSGLSVVLTRDPYYFTEEKVREHYHEHEAKDFFESLVRFTMYGLHAVRHPNSRGRRKPTALYILEGENAIEVLKGKAGATIPGVAKITAIETGVETIRSRYGRGIPDNAFHRSDSQQSASREIQLYFTEEDFRRINREDIWEMIRREPYI